MPMDNQGGYREDSEPAMKIFVGADHRGYNLKGKVVRLLTGKGHNVVDVGTHLKGQSCDYPRFSYKVAASVVKTKGSRGILLCMTGIGHSIAANKIPGVRAALCYNQKAARLSRSHNDANILVIGSQFVGQKENHTNNRWSQLLTQTYP